MTYKRERGIDTRVYFKQYHLAALLQNEVKSHITIKFKFSHNLADNIIRHVVGLDFSIHNGAESHHVADITADMSNYSFVCKRTNGVIQSFDSLLKDNFIFTIVNDGFQIKQGYVSVFSELVE